MRIHVAVASLLISVSTMVCTTTVQAAESCVPSFIKENKKYYIETPKHEMKVKIMKIDPASCWVSVKEVIPKDNKLTNHSSKNKNAFWINFNHVAVIRNKN